MMPIMLCPSAGSSLRVSRFTSSTMPTITDAPNGVKVFSDCLNTRGAPCGFNGELAAGREIFDIRPRIHVFTAEGVSRAGLVAGAGRLTCTSTAMRYRQYAGGRNRPKTHSAGTLSHHAGSRLRFEPNEHCACPGLDAIRGGPSSDNPDA